MLEQNFPALFKGGAGSKKELSGRNQATVLNAKLPQPINPACPVLEVIFLREGSGS